MSSPLQENKNVQSIITNIEKEIEITKEELKREIKTKQKIHCSLIKLTSEVNDTIEERDALLNRNPSPSASTWYDGGIWRSPQLLPNLSKPTSTTKTSAIPSTSNHISLTEMFLGIVIVLSFSHISKRIESSGRVDIDSILYFAIFWNIWVKETSYSTRFDTSDLSSKLEMLVTCFAVLFGAFSCSNSNNDNSNTTSRVMMITAAFVALLHFLLHWRVFLSLSENAMGQDNKECLVDVKRYACLIMGLTFAEFVVWMIGIFLIKDEDDSTLRWFIFLFGLLFSLRVPKTFLANDFHASCSRRGVLFILLLGFILQNVVIVAAPFYGEQMLQQPTLQQYIFFGATCVLLFCIKLLYVNDTQSIEYRDHALIVNRIAGFFFHCGEFCLLLSTTILGAGLNLITHSYLARISVLPNNAKIVTCSGFALVIASIFFIKSMHVRRVPLNASHKRLFYTAYSIQFISHLFIVIIVIWTCMNLHGVLATFLMESEYELILVLSSAASLLVLTCWLDEVVELKLYGNTDARNFRLHPFGIWCCLRQQPSTTRESLSTDAVSITGIEDEETTLFFPNEQSRI